MDRDSALFEGFDPAQDAVWMAEVVGEATHVWSHKLRLAFFFSAMRHFREVVEASGRRVLYTRMEVDGSRDRGASLAEVLDLDLTGTGASRLVVVRPGDYRVLDQLIDLAQVRGVPLEIREDSHFYDLPEGFRDWAAGRKTLVLETYYREMRRRHGILLETNGKPVGGEWNYDGDNRESFGRKGPPADLPQVMPIEPDAVTREVIEMVNRRFADHPGHLECFDLPVSRNDALKWLNQFIDERLPHFGDFQDALWSGQRFLYHSRLSALLNVKLLHPREVVAAVVAAWEAGRAPLNSVEGFVRQVIGWREYVRGIYWLRMPDYLDLNFLEAKADLPSFFWDGKTEMACLADAMENVLNHGYAHHIQRLMVLGLFAQLFGVRPRAFHEWHLAMYLDAIDWVSAPNTIGMSHYADGGVVGTKPYCASGNYINRMSNHCAGCRFDPGKSVGEDACPFTTLYWAFLDRNRGKLKGNQRMAFQMKNLERKNEDEMAGIRARAREVREVLQG